MSQRAVVIVAIAAIASVQAYQSGAPPEACVDMLPQHGVAGQTSPLPFNVAVTKPMIKAGDTVSISIKGSDKKFKGFLAQVRVGDTPVGKFLPTAGTKVIDCGTGKGNAVTHSKPDAKPAINLQWAAPPNLAGQAYVYVTVAENGGTYWVKQKTASIKIIK